METYFNSQLSIGQTKNRLEKVNYTLSETKRIYNLVVARYYIYTTVVKV